MLTAWKWSVVGLIICLLVTLALTAIPGKKKGRLKDGKVKKQDSIKPYPVEKKICVGTSALMSVSGDRERHYQNLRDRYINCTYVDGNLELTFLENNTFDFSFLEHIREVTGYVLITHIRIDFLPLPNLQIIRGRTLFQDKERGDFALYVALTTLKELSIPNLRDILRGKVALIDNYNLCYAKSIVWADIITGHDHENQSFMFEYHYETSERTCSPCHPSCEGHCWGEGPKMCQKLSKVNCSAQCSGGRCFGPNPRDCCHLYCAGACSGPTQKDCLACRDFSDDGTCKQECPPIQIYDPATFQWKKNPEGKYAYGATCVKECPDHLLRDNGACVRICPDNVTAKDGECVLCDGHCPKTCRGVDIIYSTNVDNFKDCTIVEGQITILQSSFDGYTELRPSGTDVIQIEHKPMHPSRLEIFKTLKEVTAYINIQGSHPNFTNLLAFEKLETVGGRSLTDRSSSIFIIKSSLKFLGLKSLKTIRSGSITIVENKKLCLATSYQWKILLHSKNSKITVMNNRPNNSCEAENMTCNRQCSDEGCWGPGVDQCISCANYTFGDICIESCNHTLLIYDAGNKTCQNCHEQCKSNCNGPGSNHCDECRNAKDGPYCVDECPSMKYKDDNGICQPCHENCVQGCTGIANRIGEGGCKSCHVAVVSDPDDYVEECLTENSMCPERHYAFRVPLHNPGRLTSMAEKIVCKKCHNLCRKCSGPGIYCDECEYFRDEELCVMQCPSNRYVNESGKHCQPCSDECRKGCSGPETTDCVACRNVRVYYSDDINQFNCTASCPPDKPYRTSGTETGKDDFFCVVDDQTLSAARGSNIQNNITEIVSGVIGCVVILGIFLAVFGYQCYQRARAKENTLKMTMRMSGIEDNEPLTPTDAKPNLAKLILVKEAELRRGGILGYGAFGTVYKGVWVPDSQNVKIPVAIKVLKEGTEAFQNNEILQEAYIMASVDHPHLVRLLAVCMASQTMLITQLMPLGCLLDYVRNNKDRIGSKPLLNWCTQIAKGMAYLEERRLVHRDLAARNVLVQTPGLVKITDFGLAKLLDINEEEYKAAGGKMPIKWLALECIQHRIFTHKSDVWAFGVTVWELLTYGNRPYENTPAREVPDLLEKGERLSQPSTCTIDVYMLMIKCWMLDAESRPAFKDLAEEFSKMARDPGRYLVIPGDKLMRLPSYTSKDDEQELMKTLSIVTGPEPVIDAEEYLQPKVVNLPEPPNPSNVMQAIDKQSEMSQENYFNENFNPNSERRYGHLDGSTNSPKIRQRENSVSSRYISDPCKTIVKDRDDDGVDSNGFPPKQLGRKGDFRLEIPVDEDDYLMPCPLTNQNVSTYMDLIPDGKGIVELPDHLKKREGPKFIPNYVTNIIDNPEYHIMGSNVPTSPGPHISDDSEQEYYNEYDKLHRELVPLNLHKNETTV